MARVWGKTRLLGPRGEALLASYTDEDEGYKRNLIGFGTGRARDEYNNRGGDVGPLVELECDEEAEGIWLEGEEEEGEEA